MRFVTTCQQVKRALALLKASISRGSSPQTALLLAVQREHVCLITAHPEFVSYAHLGSCSSLCTSFTLYLSRLPPHHPYPRGDRRGV